jgi:hypothetical protein
MKKTYMQPEMDVISLKMKQGLLFGSATGDPNILNGGGNLGDFDPGNPLDARELLNLPVNIFE